jgi:hypothetical protein
MTTLYGRTFQLRLALMAAALIAALALAVSASAVWLAPLAVLALAQAVLGRALFYAVVVPTTMPGAYFWKNPGFVEHAREIGLADRYNVGVVSERHHKFRLDELLKTIRETTWKEKRDQLRRIFTG